MNDLIGMVLKTKFSILFLLSALFIPNAKADISIYQTFILNDIQQLRLQKMVENNYQVKRVWDDLLSELDSFKNDKPHPIEVIHYEGLLDTNPDRIKTQQSLLDMNKIASFLFAYYVTNDTFYENKLKKFILNWASTYKPTGNPINENKFEPLIHSYYVIGSSFNPKEKNQVESWLKIMVAKQKAYNIPANNWLAKHLKIMNVISLILDDDDLTDYTINKFKQYVDQNLYADGSSDDLKQRDALHYHISGLEPLMVLGIHHQLYQDEEFNFFTYTSPCKSSVKKSVQYVIPYATGEKTRKEWVNSKVDLDRRRAEAGLKKYQPGMKFDPYKAYELFVLASFFDDKYDSYVRSLSKKDEFGKCKFTWDRVMITALGG